MSRRKKLLGHMEVGCMVVMGEIEMTWSKMTDCWKIQIGEGVDTGAIIVLVLTSMMINIFIILTGGAIRGIRRMSLRKKSYLHLMER